MVAGVNHRPGLTPYAHRSHQVVPTITAAVFFFFFRCVVRGACCLFVVRAVFLVMMRYNQWEGNHGQHGMCSTARTFKKRVSTAVCMQGGTAVADGSTFSSSWLYSASWLCQPYFDDGLIDRVFDGYVDVADVVLCTCKR